MVSFEAKNRVAEACSSYDPIHFIFSERAVSSAHNCNNCTNFVKEKCLKNLFNDTWQRISLN